MEIRGQPLGVGSLLPCHVGPGDPTNIICLGRGHLYPRAISPAPKTVSPFFPLQSGFLRNCRQQ